MMVYLIPSLISWFPSFTGIIFSVLLYYVADIFVIWGLTFHVYHQADRQKLFDKAKKAPKPSAETAKPTNANPETVKTVDADAKTEEIMDNVKKLGVITQQLKEAQDVDKIIAQLNKQIIVLHAYTYVPKTLILMLISHFLFGAAVSGFATYILCRVAETFLLKISLDDD